MAHTQSGIPFSGVTPQSRHASHQGAEAIAQKQPALILRYLRLLVDAADRGVTDQEAAVRLDCKVSTVNARRGELMALDLVKPGGCRPGDSGTDITVWRLAR